MSVRRSYLLYSLWIIANNICSIAVVHVFKKRVLAQLVCNLFEQMNNLRTVARRGVDKFTSSGIQAKTCVDACEFANTLCLEEEEEYYTLSFFKGNSDILTLALHFEKICCAFFPAYPKVDFF